MYSQIIKQLDDMIQLKKSPTEEVWFYLTIIIVRHLKKEKTELETPNFEQTT
jgi:hypothetical protein